MSSNDEYDQFGWRPVDKSGSEPDTRPRVKGIVHDSDEYTLPSDKPLAAGVTKKQNLAKRNKKR